MTRPSDPRRTSGPRIVLPQLHVPTRGNKELVAGTPPPSRSVSVPRQQTTAHRPPARSRTAQLQTELAERTADVQRVKAEYDNYRKRVQRDRMAIREIAVANVLRSLLPVLDAIARARELGEVHGGFQLVAEELEGALAALGLQAFGEAGEPFDPECHEALLYAYSAEVDGAVCGEIFALGYRVGDHLLRPAQAAVTEPPPAGGG